MGKEGMIQTIADALATNKVDSNVITKVLTIISDTLAFDGGLIYEVDQEGNFFLAEHTIGNRKLRPSFSNQEMEHNNEYMKDNDRITYITNTNTHYAALLERYQLSSLLLVNLVDENSKKIGFIVFVNLSEKRNLTEEFIQQISGALYMYAHYIEIRILQRKLAFTQNSFESILDNTGIDIYVNDFYNHDILYVNKSMAAPYGGVEKFKNRKCHEILFPEQNGPCSFCPQKHIIDENGDPTKIYTWDYKRTMDGEWFRVFSSAFRWTDGRLGHVVSSANITDNKRNEELIIYMANYDALTKLPNRRKLVSDLEKLIIEEQTTTKYVLFFDIDGFKTVNDDLGHDAGDEFLEKLGSFFASLDGLKDKIYRHGGDEFVAIIDGDKSKEEVKAIIQIIHQRFSEQWDLKKGSVKCNTSVGIATYPEDGDTVDILLYKADQAMYQIKKEGGGALRFH